MKCLLKTIYIYVFLKATTPCWQILYKCLNNLRLLLLSCHFLLANFYNYSSMKTLFWCSLCRKFCLNSRENKTSVLLRYFLEEKFSNSLLFSQLRRLSIFGNSWTSYLCHLNPLKTAGTYISHIHSEVYWDIYIPHTQEVKKNPTPVGKHFKKKAELWWPQIIIMICLLKYCWHTVVISYIL